MLTLPNVRYMYMSNNYNSMHGKSCDFLWHVSPVLGVSLSRHSILPHEHLASTLQEFRHSSFVLLLLDPSSSKRKGVAAVIFGYKINNFYNSWLLFHYFYKTSGSKRVHGCCWITAWNQVQLKWSLEHQAGSELSAMTVNF